MGNSCQKIQSFKSSRVQKKASFFREENELVCIMHDFSTLALPWSPISEITQQNLIIWLLRIRYALILLTIYLFFRIVDISVHHFAKK